jgi:hypothetical protein
MDRLEREPIAFSPQVVSAFGLHGGRMSLEVGGYTAMCVPYQFAASDFVLFGVLSPREVALFAEMRGAVATITMAFRSADPTVPVYLLIRGKLTRVGPIRGRETVCLFSIHPTSIPAYLAGAVRTYFRARDLLKQFYSRSERTVFTANPDARARIGLREVGGLTVGDATRPGQLEVLGPSRAEFVSRGASPPIRLGTQASTVLSFDRFDAKVKGVVKAVRAEDAIHTRLVVALAFNPELVCVLQLDAERAAADSPK